MPRGIPNTTSTDAKHVPVLKTAGEMASQHDIGQGNERVLKSTGDAKTALEASDLSRLVDHPVDPEYMAMLAFMEEPVTIRIGTSTDKNAAQVFEININGKLELFRRGETKTVKRYFVDRMLRLKETAYTQREVINSDGIKDIVNVPHTALKYDFSVERDDNKLGESWKRAVLLEAA
jgi:hypothetical protein